MPMSGSSWETTLSPTAALLATTTTAGNKFGYSSKDNRTTGPPNQDAPLLARRDNLGLRLGRDRNDDDDW